MENPGQNRRFEVLFDHEAQESSQTLVTVEPTARQYAIQLLPHGVNVGFRRGHHPSIPHCFQCC